MGYELLLRSELRNKSPPTPRSRSVRRTARPPSPRAVAGWLLRHPDTLTGSGQLLIKAVRTRCIELDALTRHVRSFAAMLTGRRGERLPHWLDTVRQDELSETATPSSPASHCPGTRAWSTRKAVDRVFLPAQPGTREE